MKATLVTRMIDVFVLFAWDEILGDETFLPAKIEVSIKRAGEESFAVFSILRYKSKFGFDVDIELDEFMHKNAQGAFRCFEQLLNNAVKIQEIRLM